MKLKQIFIPLASLAVALGAFASAVNFTYDGAGRLTTANYNSTTNLAYTYDNAGNLLLGSSPGPAVLVGSAPGQITISWPIGASGYVLQRATTLSPTPNLSDYTASTTQQGSFYIATLPIGPGLAFYRLRN
jgi:YD repeat-containing protein